MAVAGAPSTDPRASRTIETILWNTLLRGEHCKEAEVTLETQITNDGDTLSNAQTKTGSTTEKEATAGETARQTSAKKEHSSIDSRSQATGACFPTTRQSLAPPQ